MNPEQSLVTFRDESGFRWTAQKDFADSLRKLIPRLDELLRDRGPGLVKSNLHRTVLRCSRVEVTVYVKIHHPARLRYRLRQHYAGTRARREWTNAQRLTRLDLAVARPLAFGEGGIAGRSAVSYYVCEQVAGSVPLAEFLGCASAADRSELLSSLAQNLARIHSAQFQFSDLHANNVLVSTATLTPVLLDLHGVRKVRLLGWARRLRGLAKLIDSLEGLWLTGEIDRFLSDYVAAIDRPHTEGLDPSWAQSLVKELAKARYRRLRSVNRRAVLRSRTPGRSWVRRSYRSDGLSADQVDACVEMLRQSRAGVEIIKQSERSSVYAVRLEDRTLAVKVYKEGRLKGLLRFLLGTSRCEKAWRAAHGLLARGISVPTPVACQANLFGPDYLMSELVSRVTTLDRFVEQALPTPGRERMTLIDGLSDFVARLHRYGVRHPDLSPKNIVLDDACNSRFYLMDLDGIHFRVSLSRKWILRALGQLNDLPAGCVKRAERLRFLKRYCGSLGREDVFGCRAEIERHTHRRAQRRAGRMVAIL